MIIACFWDDYSMLLGCFLDVIWMIMEYFCDDYGIIFEYVLYNFSVFDMFQKCFGDMFAYFGKLLFKLSPQIVIFECMDDDRDDDGQTCRQTLRRTFHRTLTKGTWAAPIIQRFPSTLRHHNKTFYGAIIWAHSFISNQIRSNQMRY